MIIHLRCDVGRPRAWIATAIEAFARDGHRVGVDWIETGSRPPSGFDLLLEVERILLARGRPSAAARLEGEWRTALPIASGRADLVIDFTEAPRPGQCRAGASLRPLYNGVAGEDAALAAILAGDMPVITIMDEVLDRIVDHGHPSSEDATGVGGQLGSVMARTLTLLRARAAGRLRLPGPIVATETRPLPRPMPAYVARGLAHALAKRLYHLCCYAPQWHIGWRFVEGGGVWHTFDLSGPPWRRLPNRPHCFNADPFPVTWKGRTALFFEELDHRVGKGLIAAVGIDDAGPRGAITPVLEEPWHLSYPFLIEDGGQLWMIPESSQNGTVDLYRCVAFPGRWVLHTTLLSDLEFADATIVRHEGRLYMFGVLRDGWGGYSDTLAIFHAERLEGPWLPHDANPILIDRAAARPAGHFVRLNGRLWRPVQDCSHGYGAALGLAEVTALSPHTFRQDIRRTLGPSTLWPGRKLHTLNRAGRLETIDGSRIQPKISWILSGSRAGESEDLVGRPLSAEQ